MRDWGGGRARTEGRKNTPPQFTPLGECAARSRNNMRGPGVPISGSPLASPVKSLTELSSLGVAKVQSQLRR